MIGVSHFTKRVVLVLLVGILSRIALLRILHHDYWHAIQHILGICNVRVLGSVSFLVYLFSFTTILPR